MDLQSHFEARAAALMAGMPGTAPEASLAGVDDAMPMPVFGKRGTQVVHTAQQNLERMRRLRAAFRRLGTNDLRAEFMGGASPSPSAFVAHVRLIHLSHGSLLGARSEVVYYLRTDGPRITTEMVEIPSCPAHCLTQTRALPLRF